MGSAEEPEREESTGRGDAWARAKPHVVAALVAVHVLAVLVLSLPDGLTNRRMWKAENLRSDFAGWAKAMRAVGIAITDEELADKARRTAEGYTQARDVLGAPFEPYETGGLARQGWAMFASPQRHPSEVHVDVDDGSGYRPLFRPRSSEHRWFSRRLDHHRLRKLMGRFARGFNERMYDDLARYLASRAFSDFPDAQRVRVRLYSWDALPPGRVVAGEKPRGRYREARVFTRGEMAAP